MDRYLNANIVFSKFSRDYMELKKDLPIRPSEMGVLNIIVKREGLFTPIMIADLLEVSKAMVTTHISVLEKKGYVYRDFSSTDKRSFYVLPTDKARRLVEDTEKKLNVKFNKIEEKIGRDNFDLLISLLENSRTVFENRK